MVEAPLKDLPNEVDDAFLREKLLSEFAKVRSQPEGSMEGRKRYNLKERKVPDKVLIAVDHILLEEMGDDVSPWALICS